MPRFWYDVSGWNADDSCFESEEVRELNRRIVADKKPYFMIYIYPDLMKRYKTYVKHTATKAMCCVGSEIDALKNAPEELCSEQQREFMDYCNGRMPVGTNVCLMNSICDVFETEFDGCVSRYCVDSDFDYSFMKSGKPYMQSQYTKIAKEYKEYLARQRDIMTEQSVIDTSTNTMSDRYYTLNEEFMRNCLSVCTNEETLCDILLDVCYKTNKSRQFVWSMCGEQIVENLEKSHNVIKFPMQDIDGSIDFAGMTFTMSEKETTYYVRDYSE